MDGGQIGIHRPYNADDTFASPVLQEQKYERIGADASAFLKEMNVPVRLYEDSLFISPEHMKILTTAEMQGYGLSVNDPYAEEANAVERAKILGISRQALAQREARSSQLCPEQANPTPASTLAWSQCRNEVLRGQR